MGDGQYTWTYQFDAIGNITSTSRLGNYAYPPSGAASVRPHAVISTTSGYSYTYDANGNMLTRIELSGTLRYTYTQQWDVENHLIAVTSTATLTVTRFYYDGDGQRVKKVESRGGTTITTAYVGAHFEKNVTAGVTTTYYYAGATRVAMRQGSSVYYIHADHLGSASLTTDYQGNKLGELRYMPYGETRYVWGTTPTDRRYTGQREEAALGSLYDYGARFYSPSLGRFLSADTMVPSPGNPQSLNRYSYALNNALKYMDPTGHAAECGDTAGGGCGQEGHVDWDGKTTGESWADYFARNGMKGGETHMLEGLADFGPDAIAEGYTAEGQYAYGVQGSKDVIWDFHTRQRIEMASAGGGAGFDGLSVNHHVSLAWYQHKESILSGEQVWGGWTTQVGIAASPVPAQILGVGVDYFFTHDPINGVPAASPTYRGVSVNEGFGISPVQVSPHVNRSYGITDLAGQQAMKVTQYDRDNRTQMANAIFTEHGGAVNPRAWLLRIYASIK